MPRSVAVPDPPKPAPAPAPAPALARRVIARAGGRAVAAGPVAAPARSWRARLADRVAGWLLGPESAAFRGQIAGATGRVANRLDRGESVLLTLTGTAGVPAAALASWLPGGGLLPDLGGNLRMAGMLARKNDGKLLLTLTFQAGEGASWTAGGGISGGVTLGGRRFGFKLGAEQTVGADLSQVAVATLKFDPRKPDDVRRLRDLVEGGGPQALTRALARALEANRQTVSAGLGAGLSLGTTFGATIDTGAAKVKAKLGLLAGAAGEVYRTWSRDGSVTDMVGFESGVEGALKLPTGPMGLKGKATDREAVSFSVTRGADGALAGIAAAFTDAVSGRAALDGVVDLGAKLQTKAVLTRELNAAGLAAAARLMAAGATALEAYRRLAADPALVTESRSRVDGRSLTAGVDGGVGLGGHRLALTGLVAGGNMRRTADDGDADPSLRELLMLLKGWTGLA